MNTFLHQFTSHQPVFIDSACFIYAFEKHPLFSPLSQLLFNQISAQKTTAFTSIITVTEVLTQPYKDKRIDLVDLYNQIFFHTDKLCVVTPDEHTAIKAAQIRATNNLGLPDAYQLALAIESNCKSFITNDQQLKKIPTVKVLCLNDFT